MYPLVPASLPVIFWYAENAREAFLSEVMFTLFVSMVITMVLTALVRLLVRDDVKSVAIMYVVLFGFFSYGFIGYFLYSILGMGIGNEPYLALFLVIITVLIIILLLLCRVNLSNLVRFATFVLLSLLIFNVARTIVVINSGQYGQLVESSGLMPNSYEGNLVRPDIYYIVIDAYGNADHIRRNFDFDNHQFTGFLRDRGFHVSDFSVSNYSHTWVSTASTLSMRYLNPGDDEIAMVDEVPVTQLLKPLGYKHVRVQSGRGISNRNSMADVELFDKGFKHLVVNEFSSHLLLYTLAFPLLDHTAGVQVNDPFVRNKISAFYNTIGWIKDVPDMEEPTFTFAHLYSLHTPYVFLRDGTVRSNPAVPIEPSDINTGKHLYSEAVKFTNHKLEEVITHIFQNSNTEPIIVMQGDHSAWGMPWSLHIEREELLERTAIFNAIYLPSNCRSGLYPDMTPVNTFRVAFNSCFGADFDILPDYSYDFPEGNADCHDKEICGPRGGQHNGLKALR